MPVACSIPTLPGSGVDQPALLEAVVCHLADISSRPSRTCQLGLPEAPAGREQAPGQESLRVTSSCLGVPEQGTSGC